jgi:hypothetical protein
MADGRDAAESLPVPPAAEFIKRFVFFVDHDNDPRQGNPKPHYREVKRS